MSAGTNWGLFDTMDILKQASGQVVHQATSQMPGPIVVGLCDEELSVSGVPKPDFFNGEFVTGGVVTGTNIGYVYVSAWVAGVAEAFAQVVYDLTQVRQVDALIVDMRFNIGGQILNPLFGLGVLFEHPEPTIGYDIRATADDHLKMRMAFTPSQFRLDFLIGIGPRIKLSFGNKPVAVLVGPGAVSTADLAALWLSQYPNVRVFGKSTSAAFTIPTQPGFGAGPIDLGPDWSARIGEFGAFHVGAPKTMLTHLELRTNERVWLTPDDVAAGRDTVVTAALAWIASLRH
jgi:C-terminal processing protease CtpA/Prc